MSRARATPPKLSAGPVDETTRLAERPAGSHRLPKSRRLLKRKDFLAVREHGTSKGGRFLVVGLLADPGVETFQFGLVTTKRCGGAVVRNRIRRRLREIVRMDQDFIRHGFKFTLIARHTAATASHGQLRQEWRRLAARLGLLEDSGPPSAAGGGQVRSGQAPRPS